MIGSLRDRVVRTPVLRFLVMLVVAFGGWMSIAAVIGGDEHEGLRISAEFKDVSPLVTGNDVMISGVRVGTIASMDTIEGGARLVVDLATEALPVYRNATLSSRPLSLLGERYLDLDPGTPDAGLLEDGDTLGVEQTGSATDLDDVLNALDRPTSQSLAALVTTLGIGLDGNGENLDEAIKALAPVMTDTNELVAVLRDQNMTLSSLVESLEPVASSLAADGGDAVDQLVDSAHRALEVTAANEQAFRALLAQLPSTLNSAIATLSELEGTADAAVPTLQGLQPLTSDLNAVSRELMDFVDALDPALKSTEPVLDKAEQLINAALPVAQQLRSQGADLTSVATSVDPLTEALASDFTSVMEFFRGWALATNGRDGLAHYFRAGLVVTPYSVTGLLPSLDGTRPLPILDPDVAEPAASAPSDSAGAPVPQVEDLTSLLPNLLSPSTTQDGGVTGLNPAQEKGILELLLGGL